MIRTAVYAAVFEASSGAYAQTEGALPASTLITVTPNEEITSKKVEVGTRVLFSVVNDIVENGVVAIPRVHRSQEQLPGRPARPLAASQASSK